MESKHLISIVALLGVFLGSTFIACISKRARDVLFFIMVLLAPVTTNWDVNFVSREWYRGTTCGFEISLVDPIALAVLFSAILAPRPGERRWFWPASLLLMVMFFWFSVLCVALADPKLFGMFSLMKLIRGMIIFIASALYVRNERELKLFLVALGIAVAYQGFLAIEQRYRFGIHRVFSSLDAPNSLSMFCCMTAPVFVAAITSRLPKYIKLISAGVIALACLSVILTISRAGLATIALVLMGATLATISYKVTLKKLVVTAVVGVAAVAALGKSWETLSSRFGESTLEEEYQRGGNQGRGYYIRIAGAIVEEHLFGVGPNNWSYWVSNRYGPRFGYKFAPYRGPDRMPRFEVSEDANVDDPQAAPAHSLAALTVGEMGFGGLLLLILLWARWFQMGISFLWRRTPDPMRRIGVGILFGTAGIFLQSFTEWVYYQSPIFFTFHIMLGVLASLYYRKKRELKLAREREASEAEESWNMTHAQTLT